MCIRDSGKALFGYVIHPLTAYLHFYPLAFVTHQGYVKCLKMCIRDSYDGMELEVKLLLDTLHTETPALTKELNDKLFY